MLCTFSILLHVIDATQSVDSRESPSSDEEELDLPGSFYVSELPGIENTPFSNRCGVLPWCPGIVSKTDRRIVHAGRWEYIYFISYVFKISPSTRNLSTAERRAMAISICDQVIREHIRTSRVITDAKILFEMAMKVHQEQKGQAMPIDVEPRRDTVEATPSSVPQTHQKQLQPYQRSYNFSPFAAYNRGDSVVMYRAGDAPGLDRIYRSMLKTVSIKFRYNASPNLSRAIAESVYSFVTDKRTAHLCLALCLYLEAYVLVPQLLDFIPKMFADADSMQGLDVMCLQYVFRHSNLNICEFLNVFPFDAHTGFGPYSWQSIFGLFNEYLSGAGADERRVMNPYFCLSLPDDTNSKVLMHYNDFLKLLCNRLKFPLHLRPFSVCGQSVLVRWVLAMMKNCPYSIGPLIQFFVGSFFKSLTSSEQNAIIVDVFAHDSKIALSLVSQVDDEQGTILKEIVPFVGLGAMTDNSSIMLESVTRLVGIVLQKMYNELRTPQPSLSTLKVLALRLKELFKSDDTLCFIEVAKRNHVRTVLYFDTLMGKMHEYAGMSCARFWGSIDGAVLSQKWTELINYENFNFPLFLVDCAANNDLWLILSTHCKDHIDNEALFEAIMIYLNNCRNTQKTLPAVFLNLVSLCPDLAVELYDDAVASVADCFINNAYPACSAIIFQSFFEILAIEDDSHSITGTEARDIYINIDPTLQQVSVEVTNASGIKVVVDPRLQPLPSNVFSDLSVS